VRDISAAEVLNALVVRRDLDALAGRLAALAASPEDHVYIEAAMRLHEMAVESGDLERINDADSAFHDRIYRAAHNDVLMNLRDSFGLYEGYYFHPDFYAYTPAEFRQSVAGHRDILEAIRRRDATEAAAQSAANIEQAMKLLRLPESFEATENTEDTEKERRGTVG
jgi:DNA-binding GntR family transcriptional regulator